MDSLEAQLLGGHFAILPGWTNPLVLAARRSSVASPNWRP